MGLLLIVIHQGITLGIQSEVKEGAILISKGKIKLINNMVIVKKNMTGVAMCEEKARSIKPIIENLLETEKDEENKELLLDLKGSLEKIKTRKKRSLLPIVGKLLSNLFGTATESDIEKEEERLKRIEGWANHYGNVISSIVHNVNDHVDAINNVSETLNVLSEKVEEQMDKVNRKMMIQSLIIKMKSVIDFIKGNFEGLIMAYKGIVTINLLDLNELKNILEYSIINFMFKPLSIDMLNYYNLMHVKVVQNQVYILIPFNSEKDMVMHEIIPFPINIEGKSVILDEPKQVILESKENNLVSIWEFGDLDNCVQITKDESICNHELFYFQPINKFPCIKYLLHSGTNECNYKHLIKIFRSYSNRKK